jgi:hypothetical protein
MKSPVDIRKILIFYLSVLFTPGVIAQTEKQLVPSDLKQQTIVTEPVTLRKGYFRAGTLMNYRVADRYFTDAGHKEYYLTSTWGSKAAYNLNLQYGFSDRFEIDLAAEYMNTLQESTTTEVSTGTNTSTTVVAKQKGYGIGDSHMSLKYQVIPEAKFLVSLTGSMDVTFPTGQKNPTNIKSANQYDLPVGDGTYAVALRLSARSIFYPYSFKGYFGFNHNFKGSKIINAGDLIEHTFRFGNLLEAGISANLHLNEWIVLANEINYYHEGDGEIDNVISARMPDSWAASYEPSLVFQVKRFRLGESVRIPLKGKNVPADPLYIMLVQYVF